MTPQELREKINRETGILSVLVRDRELEPEWYDPKISEQKLLIEELREAQFAAGENS